MIEGSAVGVHIIDPLYDSSHSKIRSLIEALVCVVDVWLRRKLARKSSIQLVSMIVMMSVRSVP